MGLYLNLGTINPMITNNTPSILLEAGMILEFATLARVVRSSDWTESMNTSRASRESATAARRLSSLTELTRDPHDSLYRGRPSASYHREIGQPGRVPTPMNVISGRMVNPDRVEPESENSPSVIHMIER